MEAIPNEALSKTEKPARTLNTKERRKLSPFKNGALNIITKMWFLSQHPSCLMDELLHSIFFLGQICFRCPPEEIVCDQNMLNIMKECYPRPFKFYSSQVPKRSPFSCVLDMIVDQAGQAEEEQIKTNLKSLIQPAEDSLAEDAKYNLVSTAICISQSERESLDSKRYYGVSMSTFDPYTGRIIVAASCLSDTWDSNVADAVMTYYPIQNVTTKKKPNPYFDGTFEVPEGVRCETYNIQKKQIMMPCRSCRDLFGLPNFSTKPSPYGNCAETESLSKMLKNEEEVRRQVRQRHIAENMRDKVKKDIREELRYYLKEMKFVWDENFYTPQKAEPKTV